MDTKWLEHINSEMKKPYFIKLKEFIATERQTKEIYPSPEQLFRAFDLCNYWDLQVVILGSEPSCYHGVSDGLAFSSLKEASKSLMNVLVEIRNDLFESHENTNIVVHQHYNLSQWAIQGVLLLNTVLSVEKGKSESHKNKGWEEFTKNTILFLNDCPHKIVYMLWGKGAQEYKEYINSEKHLVLEAAHPNPHTAYSGFFGCRHFSKANNFLINQYIKNPSRRGGIGWHLIK